MFQSLDLDENTGSDHAALVCHFAGGCSLERFAWPCPDPMEWEPCAVRSPVSGRFFQSPATATTDYMEFWASVESSNNHARRLSHKPVVRAMSGRARVLAPQPRPCQVPPLRASRPGDRQPKFLGSCLQHVQWTKQLRRLQSYVRLASSPGTSHAHQVHRFQLWTAIRGSRGFPPSFPEWWSSRSLAVGEPAVVPGEPPFGSVARLFYLGLELELDLLEKALLRARSYARKLDRASDSRAIFASVKRNPPVQVDSLVSCVTSEIAVVDHDECALEFGGPVGFCPDLPLVSTHGSLQIIHLDTDKVWVDSCLALAPGDSVWQRTVTGQLDEIFAAFEQHWSRLWNKHADVPVSQWNAIVDFAQANLRPVASIAPSLSVDSLRRCVQGKSKHSAVGLDGVSRADVLALHDSELDSILSMYGQASSSGEWPEQVLSGYVRSLAKVEAPEGVNHYRPITVFSLLYRAWSSVCAKHWLRVVSPLVDPFLFGSTSGGRAAMVWRYVLEQVESAHCTGEVMCGFSADIVKAFNDLPRYPAMVAVKLLGVDQGTIQAWSGALSGFKRHFVVQGSYSPGVWSCNGFPEGCALSCLAMVALTNLFHLWLRATNCLFRPVSYVDNWEVLVSSPELMRQACDAVDKFASMLSIRLDASKSFVWSTDPSARASLRHQGFRVVNATRDLGAHVVYTKQLSNATSLQRFADLEDFWPKLKASACSFRQKVSLVQRVAWPRALHAISSVVMGKKRFGSLRTSAMQALGLQKPGASPDLQCFLEGPTFDPQLFAIVETLRDCRSLGHHGSVELALGEGPLGSQQPLFNTLSEILCQRIHQAGWTLASSTSVRDAIGVFSILSCGFGELLYRLQWSWTDVLASRLSHRLDFRTFGCVDVFHTRAAYLRFDGFDQGVVRKFLHGALVANEHAQHWSDTGRSCCPYCGALETAFHRLWECPHTGSLRAALPDEFLAEVPSLPTVVSVHGWTQSAGLTFEWLRYLDQLPAPPSSVDLPFGGLILDFFTDGSCLFPADPLLRVAAFAVVQSQPFALDYTQRSYVPVVAQPLRGVLQSAFRAELQALVVSLQIACQRRACVRVWTDCASVIACFKRHVVDGMPVKANSRHSDLLAAMVACAGELGPNNVAVLKVPAHAQKTAFVSELDHWLLDGNHAADLAAKWANNARGPDVWRLWNALADQTLVHRRQADLIRGHIAAVGRLLAGDAPNPRGPAQPAVPKPPKPAMNVPVMKWNQPEEVVLQGRTFIKQFGADLARDVQSWISRIRDPQQPLQWISYLHLFASFSFYHGPISIAKRNGTWEVHRSETARLSNHVQVSLRTKWFRLMLQQWLKDARIEFSTCTTRPVSNWVCCFRGVLSFQICSGEYQRVEDYFRSQLGTPATSAKALELLRL